MYFSYFKFWILIGILIFPLLCFAQPEGTVVEIFKKSCKSAWMKDTEKVKDKVSFQDFGEKYCDCMADKPMDTDDQMRKSADICMSQTLLVVTMADLEQDPGLSKLTSTKIHDACIENWNLIYSSLTGESKAPTLEFCTCASSKLNTMNANRDNLTDEGWDKQINSIAESCSNK